MSKSIESVCKINMTVLNDDGFLSPYSPTDAPVISNDVAEFLEHSAENHLPKQTMLIDVHSDCIEDDEKTAYDKAIRNYFDLKQTAAKRDLKRNLIISVIFTVIGIIGLAVMFLLDHFRIKELWVEIVDIFAWVFIWEAVDQFFIERRKLARESKKYKAFTEAAINYKKLNGGVSDKLLKESKVDDEKRA